MVVAEELGKPSKHVRLQDLARDKGWGQLAVLRHGEASLRLDKPGCIAAKVKDSASLKCQRNKHPSKPKGNKQGWQVDVQQKQPEAPQATYSAHRPKTRRDRRPASIESNHSQHPSSRRSTCLQCLNRWQPCAGTSGNDGVLGSGAAKTPTRKITSSDLWGVRPNQKRFITSIIQALRTVKRHADLHWACDGKPLPQAQQGDCPACAKTPSKATLAKGATFDHLQTVTVRLFC